MNKYYKVSILKKSYIISVDVSIFTSNPKFKAATIAFDKFIHSVLSSSYFTSIIMPSFIIVNDIVFLASIVCSNIGKYPHITKFLQENN